MKLRTVTLAILPLTAAATFFFAPTRQTTPSASASVAVAQRRAPSRPGSNARRAAARRPRVDYSKFSHRTPAHRRACDSCHTMPTPNWVRARAGEDSFPDVTDYPDHPSCVGCHRQQFFRGARPVICSICHTNVSPRDGTRHPFQNPAGNFAGAKKKRAGATEFRLNFPHDLHQDVMALARPGGRAAGAGFMRASLRQDAPPKRIDSCSICHQTFQPQGDSDVKLASEPPADLPKGAFWLKKGTFKTSPESHASCFNCHWQDGGERPLSSDCAGCHKLLASVTDPAPRPHADADAKTAAAVGLTAAAMLEKWLRRRAATFRHEETKHENVGCTSCHLNISAISLLDERTLSVPLLTCGGGGTGCHIKPTVPKKILNIEVEKRGADSNFQCGKCHLGFGRDPIPKSHLDAVPAGKPK